MQRRNRHFLWVVSVVSFMGYAQSIQDFSGKVISDSLDISGIHVVNKNSGATTITNRKGEFSIGVQPTDTIIFSAVHIKIQALVLDSLVLSQPEINVYVEHAVNELKEVVVKPHDLTGNLADDVTAAPPPPLNFNDVGIPGFEGERREKIRYSSTGNLILSTLLLPIMPLDIEGVYKQISGYNKRLRQSRKLNTQLQTVYRMIDFYGTNFLQREFTLVEEEVYGFVMACVENNPEMQTDYLKGNHPLVLEGMTQYANTQTKE
ncbi:MAG: hypothetical protein P8H63_04380 [Flavobacteriaceae bacterium]|nr:hypothetical protein [Flavobacteriaceae bacterium]